MNEYYKDRWIIVVMFGLFFSFFIAVFALGAFGLIKQPKKPQATTADLESMKKACAALEGKE